MNVYNCFKFLQGITTTKLLFNMYHYALLEQHARLFISVQVKILVVNKTWNVIEMYLLPCDICAIGFQYFSSTMIILYTNLNKSCILDHNQCLRTEV